VLAPEAVKVTFPEEQTAVGVDEGLIVGNGFTVMVTIAVFVQFAPFDPVTVKLVVTEGVTEILAPVKPPGFQVYDVAPLALSDADCPEQITVNPVAVTVGVGFTFMVTVCVFVHPLLSPITVNVVVAVGLTTAVGIGMPPGFHV
jgi:hypothetical protein